MMKEEAHDSIELLPDGTEIITNNSGSSPSSEHLSPFSSPSRLGISPLPVRLSDYLFQTTPSQVQQETPKEKKEIVWGDSITHIYEDTECPAYSTRMNERQTQASMKERQTQTGMTSGLLKSAFVMAILILGITLGCVLNNNDEGSSVASVSAVNNNLGDNNGEGLISSNNDNSEETNDAGKGKKGKKDGKDDECGYDKDNIFRQSLEGQVHVTIEGMNDVITEEEAELYASTFQESYNSVAGCHELFHRRCDNVSLSNQTMTTETKLETEITCDVSYKCLSSGICPDPNDILFGGGVSSSDTTTTNQQDPQQRRVVITTSQHEQKKDRVRGRRQKQRNLLASKLIDGAEVFVKFKKNLSKTMLWDMKNDDDSPVLLEMASEEFSIFYGLTTAYPKAKSKSVPQEDTAPWDRRS